MSPLPLALPAGRSCDLYNDHIFKALRLEYEVPDDFLNTGWDLDKLTHGGGKGGSLMANVGDSYVVKELSKADHESLLSLAPSYAEHMRTGDSLLSPIYLHFRDLESNRLFFVMKNAVGPGPFTALYDLKGCADDKMLEKDGQPIKAVHKRVWNVKMWMGSAGWTPERKLYSEGKAHARTCCIPLPSDFREQCLAIVKRDADFLAHHRIMDYSFLVAVKVAGPRKGSEASAELRTTSSTMQLDSTTKTNVSSVDSTRAARAMVVSSSDGEEVVISVAVIDFLQRWTMGKRAARIIKMAEPNKATVPPEVYARRFNDAMCHRLTSLGRTSKTEEIAMLRPLGFDDFVVGKTMTDWSERRAVPDEGRLPGVMARQVPPPPVSSGRSAAARE